MPSKWETVGRLLVPGLDEIMTQRAMERKAAERDAEQIRQFEANLKAREQEHALNRQIQQSAQEQNAQVKKDLQTENFVRTATPTPDVGPHMAGQMQSLGYGSLLTHTPEKPAYTVRPGEAGPEQAFQPAMAGLPQGGLNWQAARAAAGERAQEQSLGREENAATRERDIRLQASLRPPPAQQSVVIHTVDAEGKPVTRIVPKTAGSEFKAPTNATTANRVESAIAVNQTGNDLIEKLSSPQYAAVVGPAMGRYNTLRDFIGNPPPELAELAGTIESYALANMGVHGMRSSIGAEQIKHLLDQRHTPASLIATIRGLNKFSEHFIGNAGRTVPGSTQAQPSAAPAPTRIRYDMNGNRIQ